MKKKIPIIATLLVVILIATFCVYKFFPLNHKEIPGYEVYTNNYNSRYENAPYFAIYSSIKDEEKGKEAREYYDRNIRRCGDWLITDYEDGVCINRYKGRLTDITVPETLNGKPVVKLGSYYEYVDDSGYYEAVSAFSGIHDCTLTLPSTIKYIEFSTLWEYEGYINSDETIQDSPHITKIAVDEDNPYYYSENGVLFTKDKKTLLFFDWSTVGDEYKVPDFVETFAPMGDVSGDYGCLVFGENIKEIDAAMDDSEGVDIKEYYPDMGYEYEIELVVKGYKGTVAETWAKEYGAKFVALDE